MVRVGLGVLDALDRVVRGDLCGIEGAVSMHEGADKSGGVNVAGAMAALGELIVLVIVELAVFVDNNAGSGGFIADTGQDDCAGTESCKFFNKLFDVSFIIGFFVFSTGDQAGFCDVRKNIIRGFAKAGHTLDKIEIKPRIKNAVISHSRVDNMQAVVFGTGIENALDIVDLLCAAKITGVNGIEFDAFLVPVLFNGGDIFRQIAEGPAFEPTGMGEQRTAGSRFRSRRPK